MKYENPFPGMNPYLERPELWPDFQKGLTAGLANELGPRLPDNYRIALEQRVEVDEPFAAQSDLNVMIPDAAVISDSGRETPARSHAGVAAVAAPPDEAVAVRVRMPREARILSLRVETAPNRELVTVVEVVSPTNKRPGEGRRRYLRKREAIVAGLVNLVEIDLLRRWEAMPLETPGPDSDYRILVCRGAESPGALLYPFTARQRIPRFALPLRSEDAALEPEVDLGTIINNLHHTARYNQEIRYDTPPPEPEFGAAAQEWISERVAGFVTV